MSHCSVSHYSVRHCADSCHFVLYYTVLHGAVLKCVMLCCPIALLHRTVNDLYALHSAANDCIVLDRTMQHCVLLNSTMMYSNVLCYLYVYCIAVLYVY